MEKKDRLQSLDAFRGYDMFWIMGGEELVLAIAALLGYPNFIKSFGHVPWEGLQFMDTVFPTFLFMAGASFPFSAAKSLERGMTRGQVARRARRRGITLMLLGIVYWGFLKRLDFATCRIPSVLGYIGFGWMCAAWIYLYVKNNWTRLGVMLGILAAVTLFFGFVPAPDAPATAVKFSPEWHFGCWLDRTILGPHSLGKMFDNEGFGGLFCTIGTAMLGMFAGEIVRRGGNEATGRKALQLLGCAAACLVSGLALSLFYPIVKNLWSPSFVLTVGSYSFAMFALFYWIVDVKKLRKWSFFFQVIGMNSITIYMAQQIVNFNGVSKFFLGGLAGLLSPEWGRLVLCIGYIAACWLFLLFLSRKNVFLKV